jgi:hypothetical protein
LLMQIVDRRRTACGAKGSLQRTAPCHCLISLCEPPLFHRVTSLRRRNLW